MDATTLETLATFPLPPRTPGGGNVFTDFGGRRLLLPRRLATGP